MCREDRWSRPERICWRMCCSWGKVKRYFWVRGWGYQRAIEELPALQVLRAQVDGVLSLEHLKEL